MSSPKNQHYVPICYLKAFVDPHTPAKFEPYVWIFDKKSKKPKNKAPRNILTETDLYTINISKDQKDYRIEETLQTIESKYAIIFEKKIKKRLPLSENEYLSLCAFVAAMLTRTLAQKENFEGTINEMIKMTEAMEEQFHISPNKSQELKEIKKDVHKRAVVDMLPMAINLLFNMNLSFLCADKTTSRFITSDNPCCLFNPDLQWQGFLSPGLGQKGTQVTIALSPEIMACLTWGNVRGYINVSKSWVDDLNRITYRYSHQYFISHTPNKKIIWFSPYPLHIFFLLRVLKFKINKLYRKIKTYAIRERIRNYIKNYFRKTSNTKLS